MSKTTQRIATALRNPTIGIEYASWILRRKVLGTQPARNVHGVALGGFNGFSQYHSVSRGITIDEALFVVGQSFGLGAIIDIGANLGLFSLLLAKQIDNRPIHAIEPNPSTFDSLRANVEANGRKNIACYKCAIADYDGLRGAARILASVRPPVVYFEVCPDLTRAAGFDPNGPAKLLTEFGYELNRIGPRGRLQRVGAGTAAEVERVENWVAVRSS